MPQSSVLTLRRGEVTARYPSRKYQGISYQPYLYGKPYAAWFRGMIIGWYETEDEAREELAAARPDRRTRPPEWPVVTSGRWPR
jgi:hypothetical protein